MKYDVYLYDPRTNYGRHVDWEQQPWPKTKTSADDAVRFNWGENNFSDDCNRWLYLYDWGKTEGVPIPPDPVDERVSACTEFIKVRIVNCETRQIVYDELGGGQ